MIVVNIEPLLECWTTANMELIRLESLSLHCIRQLGSAPARNNNREPAAGIQLLDLHGLGRCGTDTWPAGEGDFWGHNRIPATHRPPRC